MALSLRQLARHLPTSTAAPFRPAPVIEAAYGPECCLSVQSVPISVMTQNMALLVA